MAGLLTPREPAQPSGGLLAGPQSVGRLPDGRVIVKNEPGSERGPGYSTRYQITEQTPWGWMNIPTMFGGRQVDPEQAKQLVIENGGIDPDTGHALPRFEGLEQAVAAARRESSNTDFYLDQALSRPPGDPVRMGLLGGDAKPKRTLEREPYPGEAEFFKKNPQVGGMATEDGRIILNPYSPLSSEEKRAVAMNEAARLKMRSSDVERPGFEMTPDQRDFFQTIRKGSPYGSEQDIRETIVGRIISGDPSAGNVTPQQRGYAEKLRGLLGGGLR